MDFPRDRFRDLTGIDRAPPALGESDERRLARRGLAFLYGAGATLVLITLAFPRPPGGRTAPILAAALVAYVVTVGLMRMGLRFPDRGIHVLLVLGVALIGVCVYYQGRGGAGYALMYVWVALYSFYFLHTPAAIAHLGWAAASYAGILAVRDLGPAPSARWLMLAGTMTIAGLLVGRLSGQVRRQSAALAERRVSEDRERRALEINDNVVQGLSVAKYALESGDVEKARGSVDETLAKARDIISEQLAEAAPDGVRPGDLVRKRPTGEVPRRRVP